MYLLLKFPLPQSSHADHIGICGTSEHKLCLKMVCFGELWALSIETSKRIIKLMFINCVAKMTAKTFPSIGIYIKKVNVRVFAMVQTSITVHDLQNLYEP